MPQDLRAGARGLVSAGSEARAAARFAIYVAPPQDSVLHAVGSACLGRDAVTGASVAHPETSELTPLEWAGLAAAPGMYGFHATLKPPFRLRQGYSAEALFAAVERLAALRAPVAVDGLQVSQLGSFMALTLSAPSPELSRVADACVLELDDFRAPPDPAELARRRPERLTDRQRFLLAAWGYPYVFDEWRFHMTLTGPVEAGARERVRRVLERVTASVCRRPFTVDALTIFEQPEAGAPFRAIRCVPLRGASFGHD